MTALETLGAKATFKLWASDIDSRVLASAAAGSTVPKTSRGCRPNGCSVSSSRARYRMGMARASNPSCSR